MTIAASLRRGQQTLRQLYDKFVAAAHNGRTGIYFLRDQFQIALPPERNAIILSRKVGIGPVGVRP
jgi:hypothetical protein